MWSTRSLVCRKDAMSLPCQVWISPYRSCDHGSTTSCWLCFRLKTKMAVDLGEWQKPSWLWERWGRGVLGTTSQPQMRGRRAWKVSSVAGPSNRPQTSELMYSTSPFCVHIEAEVIMDLICYLASWLLCHFIVSQWCKLSMNRTAATYLFLLHRLLQEKSTPEINIPVWKMLLLQAQQEEETQK